MTLDRRITQRPEKMILLKARKKRVARKRMTEQQLNVE